MLTEPRFSQRSSPSLFLLRGPVTRPFQATLRKQARTGTNKFTRLIETGRNCGQISVSKVFEVIIIFLLLFRLLLSLGVCWGWCRVGRSSRDRVGESGRSGICDPSFLSTDNVAGTERGQRKGCKKSNCGGLVTNSARWLQMGSHSLREEGEVILATGT